MAEAQDRRRAADEHRQALLAYWTVAHLEAAFGNAIKRSVWGRTVNPLSPEAAKSAPGFRES